MRKDDFSQIVKKSALKRSDNRCERCWSSCNLEFHHKVPVSLGGDSSLENCVVLCHNCHNIAPRDPFLLENYFLRFSSVKEMIHYYKANNTEEAIKLFSQEIGVEYKEIKKRIETDPPSHIDTIKHGMRKRVETIGHSGFNIPYGYRYEDGTLTITSKEAIVVKNIYDWYLEGKSIGEISKILNSAEIPTKKGGLWAKKTISTILKNPIYCGYHRFEEKITRGNQSKIININTFQKIQKLIFEKGGRPKFYDFD
jgi:hypothetical protein